MFISIFENMQNKTTNEEKDQVLLDHGWTLTRDDMVYYPDGSIGRVEPPDLHCRFVNKLNELGYDFATGAQGKPFNRLFVFVSPDTDTSDVPTKFEDVPVEIKIL